MPQSVTSTRNSSFALQRRIGQAKVKEFSLIDKFPFGYRNREDVTNLPPGVLIAGSQNVLTSVNGRVGITQGYKLDGQSSAILAPILSSFDWEMHIGIVQHLRAGFLTSAGNDGKLQFRYVASDGTVIWTDLLTSLTSVKFQYSDFWNPTNSQAYLLMVNGTTNLYEWSGGVTTLSSTTVNTITKSGAETFAELGFYVTAGTYQVNINGTTYTATGGFGTTTLTGVTPDPSGEASGSVIVQTPRTIAISTFTNGPGANYIVDGIANLRNQIYLGSLNHNSVFISKVNDYTNYTFTSPVRVVGEGALVTMDAPWRAFMPQEDYMTLFAGLDQIYQTKFTLSADLAKEDFAIARLKTTALQGTQSQDLTSKIKNNIVFVSNEPIVNTLGRVDNVVLTPQVSDISFPIVNDMNLYDFTDGSIFFWQNFILVAIPKSSTVRFYNMTKDVTNQAALQNATHYWEAPIMYPVSRFSIIDGDLYGHSYQTSESYKLLTGYNFNGHPIDARAVFSYQQQGVRTTSKSFKEFYVEGYITPNATLNINLNYELNGFAGQATYPVVGTDTQVVQIGSSAGTGTYNSLGKLSLGKAPLGTNTVQSTNTTNKFRVVKTMTRTPFYEFSPSFTTSGTDWNWSILAFGPAATPTSEGNNPITV